MALGDSSSDVPPVKNSIQTKKSDTISTKDNKYVETPPDAQDAEAFSKPISFKLLEGAIEDLGASKFFTPEWKETLIILKNLQHEHVKIEEAYRKEWSEMKLRYLEKFKPLYRRRWATLVGHEEDDDTINDASNKSSSDNETSPSAEVSSEQTGTKKLPRFWLKAMRNHQALDEMIEVNDDPILEFLEDIRFEWVDPKQQTSFQLQFVFAKNPYFKNRVLSKTYYLEPSEENDEESVLTKTVGTEIKWLKGKNVTEATLLRKQRNKRTNATRMVSDVVKVNSFFNFFKTYEVPPDDQLEQLTEDDVSALEMIMETEFELGAVLRDKIIPRALGWYLGTEHDDFASENLEDFEDQDASDESLDEKE